jgi:hypothetical protein
MNHRGQHAYAHGSNRFTGSATNIIFKLQRAREPLAYARRNPSTQLCERDATSITLKQSAATLAFKLANLATDVWLACPVKVRHFAQTAQVNRFEKERPSRLVHVIFSGL